MRVLLDIVMILLTPCVTCLVLWRFCPEEPDNTFVQHQEPGQEPGGEREPAADEDDVALAA